MTDRPFPHLFQPLTLRHKTLKHRLVFGAHTANLAEEWLARELEGSGLDIHNIGDSAYPRRVHMAIHEGRKVGLGL